jgi:hypothetical protein
MDKKKLTRVALPSLNTLTGSEICLFTKQLNPFLVPSSQTMSTVPMLEELSTFLTPSKVGQCAAKKFLIITDSNSRPRSGSTRF